MVWEQINQRGITDDRLLEAFINTPRHRFVPAGMEEYAYSDEPLVIGCGQTISQPYIVALMTHLLDLKGDEVVLEIGTGSGYQAAILSRLARFVHTVEFHPQLAARAEKTLAELGFQNVAVHVADGSLGWPEAAPYAGIMITAAAPEVPKTLFAQLADGGKLVLPVGEWHSQELQVWELNSGKWTHESILPVSFVPLRGKHGWSRDRWP